VVPNFTGKNRLTVYDFALASASPAKATKESTTLLFISFILEIVLGDFGSPWTAYTRRYERSRETFRVR
jgi:hypothetical protein